MHSIPNYITFLRILLIPILYVSIYIPGAIGDWLSLGIYTVACLSDFLDGYLARRLNVQSNLGRMLDPIADKLMIATVLILLVSEGIIGTWCLPAAAIILCRELLVSGLREFLMETYVQLPVSNLAKYKTTIQMLSLGFLLAAPTGDDVLPFNTEIGLTLLWLAAILTMVTGYSYLKTSLEHAD